MWRRFLILVCVVVLPSPLVRTQTKQAPPGVTFQVEVNYVDVDVVVTDEQGRFITGLTREDFEVFEDGTPQKIDMFSMVEIPVVGSQSAVIAGREILPDTQSNAQPFNGRMYVIVLDDLDVSALRSTEVKKAARQFVEQYMGANDLAAVVYTSGRSDAGQEFTSNRALVLASIDKFIGRRMRSLTLDRLDVYYQKILTGPSDTGDPNTADATNRQDPAGWGRTSDPTELERGFRALQVLDTLRNTADYMASVRGRRKAVLFFSEGLDYPINDVFGAVDATTIVRAVQDTISTAARANVNYYTIDPRGLIGMTQEFLESTGPANFTTTGPVLRVPGVNTPGSGITGATGVFSAQSEFLHELSMSQGSLRELANQTGGIAAVDTNSLSDAFDRIRDANSRYYVLGYYPPSHPRNGRFHKIEVKVRRPGLRVQARRGYASPRGLTPEERTRAEAARLAREARRPDGKRTSSSLIGVLTSPMPQSGLTMTVQAAAFKHTPGEASIAMAIEISGERLEYAPDSKGMLANKVELTYYGLNEQGKATSAGWSDLDLTLRPETRERVKAHGVRVNPRINLPPGRYQLKIGARDSVAGLSGSVFYDIEVPDFRKDKVMLGGVLLTTPSVQLTPSIQPDPVVAKILPAPATSRREFPRQDVLALYTEVYDNVAVPQARRIDVTTRIISSAGADVIVARDELVNGQQGEKPWEIFGYAKQLPLRDLPAGHYLLRVEARLRGDETTALREVPFSVK